MLRGLAFLVSAIAYGGIWLALALMFSVIFRSAATAALASLAVWLLFALLLADAGADRRPILVAPVDPYNPLSILHSVNVALGINRLSPNTLFAEDDASLPRSLDSFSRACFQLPDAERDPRRAAAGRPKAWSWSGRN